MKSFYKAYKNLLLFGLGSCALALIIYGDTETQDLINEPDDPPTTGVSVEEVQHTDASIEEAVNSQQTSTVIITPAVSYDTTFQTEDRASAHLEQDREGALEKAFLSLLFPLFEFEFNLDAERKAALEVFVSKMPEGLSEEELIDIAEMVIKNIPNESGLLLGDALVRLYELNRETEALVQSVSPPQTEHELLKLRNRFEELPVAILGLELVRQLEGIDQSDPDSDSAEQYADDDEMPITIGDFTEKLSADGLAEDQIFNQVKNTFGDIVADNYQALKDLETEWLNRYQNYQYQKQIILDAGLDHHEKSIQIEDLLSLHYKVNERQAAKAFDEMMSHAQHPQVSAFEK